MFSTIKNYLIAILAVIGAILLALVYKGKAKYESTLRNASEQARETEKRGAEALMKGLNKEAAARGDIKKRIAEFANRKQP